MADSENDELDTPSDLPDAADPKDTRKRKITQAAKERQDFDFIKSLLQSEVGRRFLWKLLIAAKTFEEHFGVTGTGFPHTEATWFIAGKQKVGWDLYHTWLRIDPIAVAAMHRENDPRFMHTKEIK